MTDVLRTLGRYELLRRIAVGGMGEIFLARLHGTAGFTKNVIIKTILPHLAAEEEFVSKFLDEGRIVVQLTHGNIVPVLDMNQSDGEYFIAMEYVPGRDLRDVIKRLQIQGKTIPIDIALHIAGEISKGLDYAHRKVDEDGSPLGLVHRDVSPSNVLVSCEGEVKIIDFGIARATNKISQTVEGRIQGKFCYMSPEQASGQELDRRSDIFSAGVLLYEMLTGMRPFEGITDLETLDLVRNCKYDPPSTLNPRIPETLDEIIAKTLARDPNERYGSIDRLQVDLVQHIYLHGAPPTSKEIIKFLEDLFPEGVEQREMQEPDKKSGSRPSHNHGLAMSLEDALEVEFARLDSSRTPSLQRNYTPGQITATDPAHIAGHHTPAQKTATLQRDIRVAIKDPPELQPTLEEISSTASLEEISAPGIESAISEVSQSLVEQSVPQEEPSEVIATTTQNTSPGHVLVEPKPDTRLFLDQKRVLLFTGLFALLALLGGVIGSSMKSGEPSRGVVLFQTQPAGARVYINNALEPGKVTPLQLSLEEKTYQIRFELEGYESSGDINLHVDASYTASNVKLFPEPAFVMIPKKRKRTIVLDSTPNKAEIIVQSDSLGQTPSPVEVTEGETIYVKLRHPRCKDQVFPVRAPKKSNKLSLQLTDCQANVGSFSRRPPISPKHNPSIKNNPPKTEVKTPNPKNSTTKTRPKTKDQPKINYVPLLVETIPSGAKLSIQGKTYTSPVTLKKLKETENITIRASLAGHKDASVTTTPEKANGKVKLTLPATEQGCVTVKLTSPLLAHIEINGKRIKGKNLNGMSKSLRKYKLSPGDHSIKVWNDVVNKPAIKTNFTVKSGPCTVVDAWKGKASSP